MHMDVTTVLYLPFHMSGYKGRMLSCSGFYGKCELGFRAGMTATITISSIPAILAGIPIERRALTKNMLRPVHEA